jgi:cell division protein ZapA
MGQVSVTLNGRTYRLSCGDGEEARLLALSEHLRAHIDKLVAQLGQVGDDRLLVMAALMITDELFEARDARPRGPEGARSNVTSIGGPFNGNP